MTDNANTKKEYIVILTGSESLARSLARDMGTVTVIAVATIVNNVFTQDGFFAGGICLMSALFLSGKYLTRSVDRYVIPEIVADDLRDALRDQHIA